MPVPEPAHAPIGPAGTVPSVPRPRFFFDYGSPYAYLTAERIEALLGPVQWCPIFLVGVFKAGGRRSWVYTERAGEDWAEVERRLRHRGLPPLTLCERWAERLVPATTAARSTLMAQCVARVAVEHGRTAAFSRALYRAEFQRGADLTEPATVLAAADEAGLPADVAAGAIDDPARRDEVRAATDEAVALGVTGVPTVLVGGQSFWGDDRLEYAAAALASAG